MALCHRLACGPQRLLAAGGLDRLEVGAVERTLADQLLDFGGDLGRDRGPTGQVEATVVTFVFE